MIDAVKRDFEERFGDPTGANMQLGMAYTYDTEAAEQFKREVQEQFPNHEITMNPLSLSVSCHIGPGALAVTTSHIIGAPL
jgi:fatty acid-binding protein DegV